MVAPVTPPVDTPGTTLAADPETLAIAVESRDPRFDGWVTVGVTSTGIYCRPSCPTPVRPKRSNMRFFATSAAAQRSGFRACKRCAPDAVPGAPAWNWRDDLVARAVRAIDDGVVDRIGVEGLAEELAVSSRHLHRLVTSAVGASPLELARSRRARAARVLIETTDLPFGDVAFAAGFDSIRQFNDTVRAVFDATPTGLRAGGKGRRASGAIEVRLPFRPPLPFGHLLTWLDLHAIAGVEEIDWDDGPTYRRSIDLPGGPGVIEVTADGDHLLGRFRLASVADLQFAIGRIRRQFDLDGDPAVIDPAVATDPHLGPLVRCRPGLRLPGEADPVECAIRAVVHQQVSVASARSILARLVAEHGTDLDEPVGGVSRRFPDVATWAALDPERLGMPRRRAETLVAVARAVDDGSLDLSPTADRSHTAATLLELPGIGPWTTAIVLSRGLGAPDVFASGDLALRRVAGTLGLPDEARTLGRAAEAWRPWRSYAMHHLWAEYLAPDHPRIDDVVLGATPDRSPS